MTFRRRAARPLTPKRSGFTILELMVVVVLGAFLLGAILQALSSQTDFYAARRAVGERNETVRFAMATLGSAFREADLALGDVEILAPDRVRVRMPYGLGVVCGHDNNGGRIGLAAPEGRWADGPGDSVIVQRTGSRSVHGIDRIDPGSIRVPCVALEGIILRLDQQLTDIVQGSPARAFRSTIFETGLDQGSRWLYRVDGATRDVLFGPLDDTDPFSVWYEDAQGAVVPDLVSAERIVLQVIARATESPLRTYAQRDTLVLSFGGRNP